MSLTPISGKAGKVTISSTSVGNVTKWTLRKAVSTDNWASSETSGKKMCTPGTDQLSGTISAKFDNDAAFPMLEGTQASLTLSTDGTVGWIVPATMESIAYEVDIDDGKTITLEAEWKSNGTWTEPTYA